MTKDVLIKIKGLQFQPDSMDAPEPVEIISPGEYYYRNGRHYVLYDEVAEGMPEVMKNIIKFNEDGLEIRKKGNVHNHMVFEKDKKTMSFYQTPFGDLVMGLDTRMISVSQSEEEIRAELQYSLDINYQYLADCTIALLIQSKAQSEKYAIE